MFYYILIFKCGRIEQSLYEFLSIKIKVLEVNEMAQEVKQWRLSLMKFESDFREL